MKAKITEFATLNSVDYAREAYEATAGIIDFSLEDHSDPRILDKIEAGRLVLFVSQGAGDVPAIREQELTVQASLRDIYLDEGQSQSVELHVLDKGRPAQSGIRILAALYDPQMNLIPVSLTPPEILMVEEEGKATLRLFPVGPGLLNIQFYPFRSHELLPTPDQQLNIRTGFFVSVRVLPFDNAFEQQTSDDQLSFRFIYENILRPYDLLNPVMARAGIDLPLDDRDKMTSSLTVTRIRTAIAASNFESARYMPVTRALSAGKRRLLERWCDLVEEGRMPADQDGGPSPIDRHALLFDPLDRMKREV